MTFDVYIIEQTGYEWIDYVKVKSFSTLVEAQMYIKEKGYIYGGVRKSTDNKPSYCLGDDGKWI
jgi:hypothetical protein